jgi:hypothetical protein
MNRNEEVVDFSFFDSDTPRPEVPIFEELYHCKAHSSSHSARSSWAYCRSENTIICCIIGDCASVCLRNRICVQGSQFDIGLLTTMCRRNRLRPDWGGQLTPSIESICISASIEASNARCFTGSEHLKHVVFEYGSKLSRFGTCTFHMTRSLHCLCLPASLCESNGSEFESTSEMTIMVEQDNPYFQCQNGLLIATKRRAVLRQFGTARESVIPVEIERLCSKCFSGRKDLKHVVFEGISRMECIEDRAFRQCSRLSVICIPASVKHLGVSCFDGCSQLMEVTFEQNSCLEVIGEYCFALCTSLKTITLPASLRALGPCVFMRCESLTCISFEANSRLERFASLIDHNSSLTSILIPASVQVFRRSVSSLRGRCRM